MDDLELIKGEDNGHENNPDELWQAYPKVNRNFARVKNAIANLLSLINGHKTSTTAHSADHITNNGNTPGETVEQALDGLTNRVSTIVQGGGPNKDGELVDIRTPDPSYTPARTIVAAGDMTRDMQAQFTAQLAETAKRTNHIEGMEYLNYYLTKVRLVQAVKILLSGDSTTANFGITDPRYYLETLIKNLLNSFGIFYANVINAGHNGAGTPQWIESYIAQDLAQNPDLYIPRWGINDGSLPKATRLATFTTNLRNGLATIRAAKSPEQMSIILMAPNSTNDYINGRDAEWYEQIVPVIRKAARDYQCCFVDTYNYMRDSTNAVWQDNMQNDGIHVHPLETANASIISLLDVPLIPPALRRYGTTNASSADVTKLVTDPPSSYPLGISWYRSGADAPYDGMYVTDVQVNGVVFQKNIGIYAQDHEGISIRRGLAVKGVPGGIGNDAWGKWMPLGSNAKFQNLSIGNGWVNFGSPYATAQYLKDSSGNVQIKGRVKSGTITTGWMIGELPEGYRALEDRVYDVVCNGAFGTVKINAQGQILTENIPSNAYVDFGTIIFKAEH